MNRYLTRAANEWERFLETPFGRLCAHFFRRFFDTETTSGETDSRIGITPILGMVAVPGAIMSILLFQKYSPLLRWLRGQMQFNVDLASLPDKYTFIVFAITLTGIVTVLKWDALFPDRRDFANLVPLPLTTRQIFSAKLLALIAFVVIFAIDLNLIPTFLFPAIVMEDVRGSDMDFFRFVAGHGISVIAATVFTFCFFLALIGTMMSVLPYAWFRRITRYVQFASVGGLLIVFFMSPVVLRSIDAFRNGTDDTARWMPSAWFLGLYYRVQGKSVGVESLAETAGWATLIAIGAAGLAYLLSYRRYFLRSAESPELALPARRLGEVVFLVYDRLLLWTGFERGCFRFAGRTVFRSDRHAAILAAALGLAVSLAVQSAIAATGRQRIPVPVPLTADMLSVPLTLVFFIVVGLRVAFGMPADARANWIFQIAGSGDDSDPRTVARKTMLGYIAPILFVVFVAYASVVDAATAILHTLFVGVLAGILIDMTLAEFRTVPCTCSFMPGRSNPVMALARVLVGYIFFARGLAGTEAWMLQEPLRFIGFYVFAIAIWVLIHRSGTEENEGIVYEQPTDGLQLLHLVE